MRNSNGIYLCIQGQFSLLHKARQKKLSKKRITLFNGILTNVKEEVEIEQVT